MKLTHAISFRFALIFVLLFVLSVPLEYHYLLDSGAYTSPFFEGLIRWLGDSVFQLTKPYTVAIISDSTGMYFHVFILAAISMVLTLLWTWRRGEEVNRYQQMKYGFMVLCSYYLSLQLFRYGFDKVFKGQFYMPEPNTVYTPLGYLSPDILYWSTIGSSYIYSVFAGLLEVIPAILLLFKRTRTIGAIIALMVMVNVLMINIGFDISVKLFSGFLLLLALIIAYPDLKKLYQLFILKKQVSITAWQPNWDSKRWVYILLKSVAIGLILFEALFIYVKTGYYNDDKVPRPYLHGAYQVLPASQDNVLEANIKRMFVHRRGYFIFQFTDDGMQDFKLDYDLSGKKLILTDYDDSVISLDFAYSETDSILTLKGLIKENPIEIQAKQLDLSKLPLLQQEIHWTIDGYN